MDRIGLIPEKELITILTDVHIADGLLTLPHILHRFSSLDSLSSYTHIIENHGYTKETMDQTLEFYIIKNPKKLIKIYDQVLGILSEMESYLEKESLITEARRANLWPGKDFYFLNDAASADETRFDAVLNRSGIYTLKFSATFFPDDQAMNPRITLYSCHPDSISSGKRDYIKTINYIKDGQPHNYTFMLEVPVKTTLHLRGWLYDFDNHTEEWGNHAIFENISIVFIRAII